MSSPPHSTLADTFMYISTEISKARKENSKNERLDIIKAKYGKEKGKFFFSLSCLKLEPYQSRSHFHSGTFSAYCGNKKAFYRFLAIDHGQYPWGRNRYLGIMANVCKYLNIKPNARNTCLTLHFIIGCLQNNLISKEQLLQGHRAAIRAFLNSTKSREIKSVIPVLLFALNLSTKVCIVIIRKMPDASFQIMSKIYGNKDKLKLYIVHSGNHFFLACPPSNTCKTIANIRSPQIPIQTPTQARPGSYESLDFGPPPADDSFADMMDFGMEIDHFDDFPI